MDAERYSLSNPVAFSFDPPLVCPLPITFLSLKRPTFIFLSPSSYTFEEL